MNDPHEWPEGYLTPEAIMVEAGFQKPEPADMVSMWGRGPSRDGQQASWALTDEAQRFSVPDMAPMMERINRDISDMVVRQRAAEAGFVRVPNPITDRMFDQPSPFAEWVSDYDSSYANAARRFENLGWTQRFITGVNQDDEDFALALRPDVIWAIPEPMTIQIGVLEDDILDLLYGGVPLCHRKIPARGTE